ncbi:MAG: hypothetical protein M3680_13110 [Myxococcota bacterium]|nr:hypothetical protein [Myxococcota bacterium]
MDTRPSHGIQLLLEIQLLQADAALVALDAALRIDAEDLAVQAAVCMCAAIKAVYRARDRLETSYRPEPVVALRHRTHRLLREYLHDDVLVRLAKTRVDEHASTLMVLTVLWKVANALDEVEEAEPS